MKNMQQILYELSLAEMININIEKSNGVTIVELLGQLDSVAAPRVQEEILPIVERDSRVLLDMSQITYMSSAGLRTLLMLYRNISENVGRIVISGLNDEVRDVMSLTGFLDFFSTVETRADGIRALH